MRKTKSEILLILIILISLSCYLILVKNISDEGVRGSDQYWYVADTESIINGEGVYTNSYYPSHVLKGGTDNPFIHNVPQVYLAALPGIIFGSYGGWIIMNVLLNIGCAILIFFLLKSNINYKIAVLVSILYLFLPISFWLSSQPLAEPFLAFLFTSFIYVYYRRGKTKSIKIRYLQLAILSVLLSVSRYNFTVVLFVVPLIYFVENRNSRYSILTSIVILLGSVLLLVVVKSIMPDNESFLNVTIELLFKTKQDTGMPGFAGIETNTLSLLEFIGNIWQRLLTAFKTQFLSFDKLSILFYIPFNLMIILIIILHRFSSNRKDNTPIIISIFLLTIHLLTAIAFQNQFRYLLPYYPVLIALFILQIDSFIKRHKSITNRALFGVIFFCLVIAIPVDIYISRSAINDARSEKEFREKTKKLFDDIIPLNDNVVIAAHSAMNHYILRPRKVLNINDSNTNQQLRYMINRFDAKWVICSDSSLIPQRLSDFSFCVKGGYEYTLNQSESTRLIVYKIIQVD